MELTGEENIYQHGQVMGLSKEEIDAKKKDIIDFAEKNGFQHSETRGFILTFSPDTRQE